MKTEATVAVAWFGGRTIVERHRPTFHADVVEVRGRCYPVRAELNAARSDAAIAYADLELAAGGSITP